MHAMPSKKGGKLFSRFNPIIISDSVLKLRSQAPTNDFLSSHMRSYGPGGTGKTFVENLILACLRAEGKICLAVASSGITSILLTGGRTGEFRGVLA